MSRLAPPNLRTGTWQSGLLAGLLLLALLAGCGRPGREVTLAPPPTPSPAGPRSYPPVALPRDELPHDVLTEWWYYTGHIEADNGARFGFEFVIFQTVRNDLVVYLSQSAVTDPGRQTFEYANRVSQGSQIGAGDLLGLTVQDSSLQGRAGQVEIAAGTDNYRLRLKVAAQSPPVLHDDGGLVSFGPAGDSYYYSYPRMVVEGTLVDRGTPLAVRGLAWFDHQWGDFLVLGGGWDWFSGQLDDGSSVMLNLLRDEAGQIVGVWGTYVEPSGAYRPLRREDFTITPTGSWRSEQTGGVYPMGWEVTLAQPAYKLSWRPLLENQELASRGTGPSYWEGAVEIGGTRDGRPVKGQGYVELTGYAPSPAASAR